MKKVLILKDNYNSFEQYYLLNLNNEIADAFFYYTNSSYLRKIMTHYGLFFESIWYGNWKNKLSDYEIVIVFDSLHTSKLLKYIRKRFSGRLIYWHWNPVRDDKERRIIEDTKIFCEHWTFNPLDAEIFDMKLNNQLFFYQKKNKFDKQNSAFFVGTDKGRYDQLVSLGVALKKEGINPDFHVIDQVNSGMYYQKEYIQYSEVLEKIKKSKIVVEITQEGQNGMTSRALEAMFCGSKLITNNKEIQNSSFYQEENIYIIGENKSDIHEFLFTPFKLLQENELYQYSAEGWIRNFIKG